MKLHQLTGMKSGHEVIKLFMLNSTEHNISTAHKTKMLKNKDIFCLQTLRCCIYMIHAHKR